MNDEGRRDPVGNRPDNESDNTSTSATEVFDMSRGDAIVLASICVAVGIALGFFLPAIGAFASRFPIPFGEPIAALSEFDQPWVVVARPVIGAILGAMAALVIRGSSARLEVGREAVTVGKPGDEPLRITRSSFSTAYVDSGKLTILTQGGHCAFRGKVEGKKERIAEAFKSRGYRWGEI